MLCVRRSARVVLDQSGMRSVKRVSLIMIGVRPLTPTKGSGTRSTISVYLVMSIVRKTPLNRSGDELPMIVSLPVDFVLIIMVSTGWSGM